MERQRLVYPSPICSYIQYWASPYVETCEIHMALNVTRKGRHLVHPSFLHCSPSTRGQSGEGLGPRLGSKPRAYSSVQSPCPAFLLLLLPLSFSQTPFHNVSVTGPSLTGSAEGATVILWRQGFLCLPDSVFRSDGARVAVKDSHDQSRPACHGQVVHTVKVGVRARKITGRCGVRPREAP